MLGRRQIREKVMQSLYAYYQSNNNKEIVERNMINGFNDIYDLYLILLSLILKIKEDATNQIKVRKNKYLASEDDKSPSKKFISNKILQIVGVNNSLKKSLTNFSKLNWTKTDSLPAILLKEIQESKTYLLYMAKESITFKEDKDFLLEIYHDIIAPSELLEELMEEKNLHWINDLHIANTMVYATIESFRENSREDLNLLKVFKDKEDEQFAINLFRESIEKDKELKVIVEEKSKNWEIERIALIDLVILQMALCEILYFHQIPHKVSINEYVELAKNYSTANSSDFINGILDNFIKEL